MADLKISALPASTTPLAGTETLPIVQGGATKKVAVSDLTAGRAVSTGDLSYTGALTGSTGVLNIGSGQFYKDATGKVGVATTSPSASLSVGDDGTATSRQISLHGPASGTNNGASINIRNGTDTVLAIGNASNIVGGAYSSDAMLFWGNASLRLYGNGATRVQLDSSGNATLSTGNLVQGTAAKGVNFTANTPAAGMTSQLLNWYEEGTFTPTFTFGGGSTGLSLNGTFTAGQYTRIGRTVFVKGAVVFSAKGSSTGDAAMGGLPFTVSGTCAAYIATPANITYTGSYTNYVSGTSLYFQQMTEAGANSTLTNTNFADNSEFRFAFTYTV